MTLGPKAYSLLHFLVIILCVSVEERVFEECF